MNHPQKRSAYVKFYTTEENKAALGAFCAETGRTVSDVMNECSIIIRRPGDPAPTRKDSPRFPVEARPKSNNGKAYFPPRQSFGVIPRMRITV